MNAHKQSLIVPLQADGDIQTHYHQQHDVILWKYRSTITLILNFCKSPNEPGSCECPTEMIPVHFSSAKAWKTFVAYFSQRCGNFSEHKMREEKWTLGNWSDNASLQDNSGECHPRRSITCGYNISSGRSSGTTSHHILLMFSVQIQESTSAASVASASFYWTFW